MTMPNWPEGTPVVGSRIGLRRGARSTPKPKPSIASSFGGSAATGSTSRTAGKPKPKMTARAKVAAKPRGQSSAKKLPSFKLPAFKGDNPSDSAHTERAQRKRGIRT